MMRCSVAEKSRPSIRVGYLPAPPNKASMTAKTSDGSQTISPSPRKGLTLTMLKLVGTAISRRKALYLCTRTVPIETSGLFLMKAKRPARMFFAKRSPTISSVGMRSRTIRSWFARSKLRTPSARGASGASESLSPEMPWSSASTSSWVRICSFIAVPGSLDDEAREVHVLDRVSRRTDALLRLLRHRRRRGRGGRFGAARLRRGRCRRRHRLGPGDLDSHRPHRLAHDLVGELFLAAAAEQILRGLARDDHEDGVADRRHVAAHLVGEDRAFDFERDADLRVAVDVAVGEVDDERVERQVGRRAHRVGLGARAGAGLGRGRAALFAGLGGGRRGVRGALLQEDDRSTAGRQGEGQGGGDDDEELLLTAFDGNSVAKGGGVGNHGGHRWFSSGEPARGRGRQPGDSSRKLSKARSPAKRR